MKGKLMRLWSVLAATAIIAGGCSEVAAPVAIEEQQGPSYGLLDELIGTILAAPEKVNVLERTSPLSRDISASAAIGKNGGTIEIPEAGIKFIVPSNALVPPSRQKTVTITVTALKGDEVAYTFQPHGLSFREPVRIEQDLKGTTAEFDRSILDYATGAYFPSLDDLDVVSGIASVLEYRPTSVDVTGNKIKFTVGHFSGYLIATGRAR